VQAAEMAMRAGEARTADRHAQDALRALGDGQELRERVERHRALTVRALAEWGRAGYRDAGRHAAGSLTALDGLNPPPTSDIGIMAFYAGVGDAIQRNHEDAAYHFTLSAAILDAVDPDSGNGTIARAWSRFSRSSLDDDGFSSLLDRLAASEFAEFIVSPEAEDDEEEAERPEGWVDATPIRRSPPDYPTSAAAAGTNGLTLFTFAINEQGRTEDIEIMYAIPHPIFGEFGQRAIRRWRYNPATVNGVPVRREGVIMQFDFTMEDD
jgi:TonB family protein